MISIAPGTITTIAGTGEPGCSGDGGPALKACLNEPKSVTIAGHALYIADSENHRIRKVDLTTGVITTVAGEGGSAEQAGAGESCAHTTDELDPLADPVKVKDEKVVQLADQSGTVRFLVGTAERRRFKGDGGPAVAATLNFPSAVAVDSKGNLYNADTFNPPPPARSGRWRAAARRALQAMAGRPARRCSTNRWRWRSMNSGICCTSPIWRTIASGWWTSKLVGS